VIKSIKQSSFNDYSVKHSFVFIKKIVKLVCIKTKVNLPAKVGQQKLFCFFVSITMAKKNDFFNIFS